jgi:hypothetical protein
MENLSLAEIESWELDLGAPPPAPGRPDKLPLPGAALGLRQRITTTTTRRRTYDLKNVPNAVDLLRPLPAENETVHGLMGGDFAGWDIVPAILALVGRPAEEACVATLGFNSKNAHHLAELVAAGQIRRVTVLASDYFARSDPSTFNEAKARLEALGQRLVSYRNHAKILALDFGSAGAFVVEMSSNLRSCNNLEQIAISRSRQLFDFHAKWISELANTPPNTPTT